MQNNAVAIGVVVASYPDGPAVDVLLPDGSRLFAVPVQVPTGSSGTGVVDLPDVGLPLDDSRWKLSTPAEYFVRAVVHFPMGLPVVSGFLLPPTSQMLFKDKNRRIMRHASDLYTSIDGAGNLEVSHPSGFYLRIGTSTAHEDLTGKDVGKKWKIKKNTGNAVHFFVSQPNGTSIDLTPDGKLLINTTSDITATVGGAVNVTAAGAATVKASSATIDAPTTHCTGALVVDGALTAKSGATVTGTMTATNVKSAAGIDLAGHHHTAQGATSATTNAQA